VKFEITGKNSTWIGLGYGKVMLNTDMHVINFGDNGNYEATDRYSFGYREPVLDTKLNGTDDLENISLSINSNGDPVVTYFRKLNTSDKYDYIFTPYTNASLIIAWGNGTISFHEDRHLASKFFLSESGSDGGITGQLDFWDFHGITLSITWILLNTLGFFFIRYLKHTKLGLVGHLIISGINSIYTIILAIITIIKGNLNL
jgi:hypothetical protein